MSEEEISQLRDQIASVDGALLDLLERRFRLAADMGRLKAEAGQPVVVEEVQREVLMRASKAAKLCGTTPEVMRAIFAAIIRGSVETQHRVRVEMEARGKDRVLVLGAAGAMGRWLCRFLESMGHRAEGVDPEWAELPWVEGRYARLEDVPDVHSYNAYVVSVPLEMTPEVLSDLAGRGLETPVFEIASIKSHLRKSLAALRKAGTPVLSLHPMFGPGKNLYEPLPFVHALGEDERHERALILDLLVHPYLELVGLPFERHDRVMGWLLGLAHLTGMLFADALSRSGLNAEELLRVASTTFSRQAATAHSILEENPDLYFAIQRLNPFRGEVYAALTAALVELTGAVDQNDGKVFREIMARAASALPENVSEPQGP